MPNLVVFSGSAHPQFAQKVVSHLHIPLGAASIGQFSDGEIAVEITENSVIDELVVTDTIPLSEEAQALGKIRQVSVASMVAETIRRINNEESISAMFDSYL